MNPGVPSQYLSSLFNLSDESPCLTFYVRFPVLLFYCLWCRLYFECRLKRVAIFPGLCYTFPSQSAGNYRFLSFIGVWGLLIWRGGHIFCGQFLLKSQSREFTFFSFIGVWGLFGGGADIFGVHFCSNHKSLSTLKTLLSVGGGGGEDLCTLFLLCARNYRGRATRDPSS